MEAQEDGLLHLSLEHINQDSEKLEAEISAGAVLGPVSFVQNLVRVESGVIHTKEKIIDMVIDPKYPAALLALHNAYLGFFGPAQKLSADADSNYQGIRDLGHSIMTETAHERDLQLLTYDRGSQTAESLSDNDQGEQVTTDAMDEHRKTLRSEKHLDILVRTDEHNSIPGTGQSMSVKYRFTTHNAKPDELRQFLQLAKILAPETQKTEIAEWTNTLNTDHPNQKRGELQGYFYLAFDPTAVGSLLESAEPQTNSQLIVNWAKVMSLPNPENWATMTADEQDQAAAGFPDGAKHLQQLRKFSKALLAAIGKKDSVGQARVFTQTVRGVDYDLYPIAALALPVDPAHLLALERITLKKNNKTDTLEFTSLGETYQFPPKNLN